MEVVGESNYQEALIAICGRHTRHSQHLEFDAVIEVEPTNAYDPNAIVVKIAGHKVGYLPREQAARISGQMREEGLSAATCGARVLGGWRTNQYDTGHYGVYLAIPKRGWIDFGIGSTPPAKPTPSRPTKRVERPEAAETGPLRGHWIALMGTQRDSKIAQELAAAGAKIMAGPGKSTTLLVIVDDKPFSIGTMSSATYRKAEELIAEGAPLRIVSIDEVRAMIAAG
ncbi:MAG TPA: HIRAN domain-containing protein [Archangium sp.]|nr:HIRAN domain-containing protein [Archangium sp.]